IGFRHGPIATQDIVDQESVNSAVSIRQWMDVHEAERHHSRSGDRRPRLCTFDKGLHTVEHAVNFVPMRGDVVHYLLKFRGLTNEDRRLPQTEMAERGFVADHLVLKVCQGRSIKRIQVFTAATLHDGSETLYA